MKTISIIILIVGTIQAQSIYELRPGVKGNQIVLQLSNISQTQLAENVEVKLIKQSTNLKFSTTEAKVENINVSEEREAKFSFDVNYTADISKQDTVEFLITCGNATDNKTILLTKQFVFTYTKPKEFRLEQNYPNPFNPSTRISYQLPASPNPSKGGALVTLKVYDILGNEVETLVNEEQQPGYYEIEFNGSRLSSGVYVYRLQAGNPSTNSGQSFVSVKKMMLLK